jgi:hypothetical protein
MKRGEKRAIPVGEKYGACVEGVWAERYLCGRCVGRKILVWKLCGGGLVWWKNWNFVDVEKRKD